MNIVLKTRGIILIIGESNSSPWL